MELFDRQLLATLVVIRSNPGDFSREYFEIVFLTTLGVKYFLGEH